MSNPLRIKNVLGTEIMQYIPIVAKLRMEIFHDFPYLYDNTLAYEEKYLSIYTHAPNFLLVLVFDGEEIVGASTGVPLEHVFKTGDNLQRLQTYNYSPANLFYLSESVLKNTYRGQGIGVRFFEERENYAKSLGQFTYTCFCAVQRPIDHPKRPADYVPLDNFWHKRGYIKHPELQMTFAWKDVDEEKKSLKAMNFWMKPLDN
ncbi:MAG: GNAT family N-acetyltransferase [Beggiatoa sp. IS2]|nr:MAG: GNAT family N-acetyltransferase [Beggiatoa sp. IS2]